ncbi:MAG: archaemetzincin family Zn-dependent metalloprotease [candidate division WOR-3 bacterium]
MIYIIPLNSIDIDFLKRVKIFVEEVYKEEILIEKEIKFPDSCFNSLRNQYDAECVLSKLKSYKNSYTLYITDNDLYVKGLNFIFGLALPWEKKSIVSIKRLKESFYGKKEDLNILILRTAKEIIHEIGHLKGLSHCSDENCVMYFSNSIYDTDRKGYRLCDKCMNR